MSQSAIPYCDETLNVVTGCSGEGCPCAPNPQAETGADRKGRCWARALCHRFPKLHGGAGYCPECDEGTEPDLPPSPNLECENCGSVWRGGPPFSRVVLHPEALEKLAKARKPKVWLVSALGDLFDKQVSFDFVDEVLNLAMLRPEHTLLLLTKQAERMAAYARDPAHTGYGILGYHLHNLWLGVTVCSQADADERIPLLLDTPAAHRWVSYEPALGPVNLTPYIGGRTHQCRCGFHETENELICWGRYFECKDCGEKTIIRPAVNWVVAGCESGPGARPCPTEWLLNVRQQCYDAGVKAYIKQAQYSKWGDPVKRVLVRFEPEPEQLPWTLAKAGPKR